jgi:hypothetical protein
MWVDRQPVTRNLVLIRPHRQFSSSCVISCLAWGPWRLMSSSNAFTSYLGAVSRAQAKRPSRARLILMSDCLFASTDSTRSS